MGPKSRPPPAPPPPLRILMLHGYTQSPALFRAKTRALAKALAKPYPALRLSYPAGPHRLSPADFPGSSSSSSFSSNNNNNPNSPVGGEEEQENEAPEAYGWWKRKDSLVPDGPGKPALTEVVYSGLESGLGRIAACIKAEGPFDGVIGFSQGAAAAAMVASLLEGRVREGAFRAAAEEGGMPFPECFRGGVDGFVQGPLKFAVCYGGFRAPGGLYAGFYEPGIRTRVLHVLGQVDVVVDEVRGMQLVGVCEGGEGRVVVHPGGHFVPSQKPWLDAVVGFVKQCMEGEGKKEEEEEEDERVEDMDVPF
ncbi:MAG: hypothetical protein Q9161_007519 [Pseudevernia consocians]